MTVARAMCMNNTLSLSPLWLLRLEHLTPQSVFPNSGIIPLLPYCCLPSLPSSDYVQIPDRCSTQVAFYGAGLNCSCSELGVTAHSSGSATRRMDIYYYQFFCSYWHPVLPVHYLPGVYGQSFRWLLEKTSVWYLYHCRSNPVLRYF